MKIQHLLIITCCCWFLLSCELSAHITDEHEPVLQVDAVIYSGESLPVIDVKRSFSATGRAPFYIEKESLLVSGADVVLLHNGNPVPVQEESPGRYLPQTGELPARGDVFLIEVSWEGKSAVAEARIPDYPVNELAVNPGTEAHISHISAGYWVFLLPVHVELPFIPDFAAIQAASTENPEACNNIFECSYNHYYGEKFTGRNQLTVSQIAPVLFPYEDGDTDPPAGTFTVPFAATIIIPEPIYVSYLRSRSDEIVANTVTNVEGGVGLFIGAIRYVKEMNVEVEVK